MAGLYTLLAVAVMKSVECIHLDKDEGGRLPLVFSSHAPDVMHNHPIGRDSFSPSYLIPDPSLSFARFSSRRRCRFTYAFFADQSSGMNGSVQ